MRKWLVLVAAVPMLMATTVTAKLRDDCHQYSDHALGIEACTKIINTQGETDQEIYYALISRGGHHLAGAEYESAIADWNRAIEVDATPDAYHMRCLTYAAMGDDRALADCDKAFELVLFDNERLGLDVPAPAAFSATRCYAHAKMGEYDRALAACSEAFRLDVDDVFTLMARGLAFAGKGDLENAVGDLRKFLDLAPDHGFAKEARDRLAELDERLAARSQPTEPEGSTAPAAEVPAGPPTSETEAAVSSTAPTPPAAPAPAADRGRRVALVVANASYAAAPLQNPGVDADLIEPVLERMGFTVTVVKDAELEEFAQSLDRFYAEARGADLALFYFAGHGFAVNGRLGAENYLMSTSADVTATLDVVIRSGGISLDEIIASTTGAARVSLVFVDACRNDPRVSRGSGRGRGLARIADAGTDELFVGLSTRLGDLAEDGEAGTGSPFARAFVEHMPTPDLPVGEAFRQVRLAVVEETGGRQRPEARDDLNSALVVVTVDN